jgi:virginiamycin B lyase
VGGITLGPDGNLWFTMTDTGQLGSVTPAGVISEVSLTNTQATPFSIVTGPDRNLWYTDVWGAPATPGQPGPFYPAIGRSALSGAGTEFRLRTNANVQPDFLTVGADGNVWFTEYDGNQIGYVTPAGVLTEVSLPTAAAGPAGIVSGPDGAIWFAENGANAIARYTP